MDAEVVFVFAVVAAAVAVAAVVVVVAAAAAVVVASAVPSPPILDFLRSDPGGPRHEPLRPPLGHADGREARKVLATMVSG